MKPGDRVMFVNAQGKGREPTQRELAAFIQTYTLGQIVGQLRELDVPEDEIRAMVERVFAAVREAKAIPRTP